MNLRQCINRKVTYTIVTLQFKDKVKTYVVYGKTTKQKELLKYLKAATNEEVPVITIKVITERRSMTLENFIQNSILIYESEEINND